jgi:predicted  nucleic acid-binding Zn-ribbon protein
MTDEPHSLILEHLRAIRSSQDRTEHDIRDLKFRVGQVEQTLAQHGTTLAHYSSRFDRLEDRLDRIEKRLGFVTV